MDDLRSLYEIERVKRAFYELSNEQRAIMLIDIARDMAAGKDTFLFNLAVICRYIQYSSEDDKKATRDLIKEISERI